MPTVLGSVSLKLPHLSIYTLITQLLSRTTPRCSATSPSRNPICGRKPLRADMDSYSETTISQMRAKREWVILYQRLGMWRKHSEEKARALALPISACKLVGIDPLIYQQDLVMLMSLQEEDGGFPASYFCCFGRTGARIGNRGLTTALAIKIIRLDS